eukprot:m51a1_g2872 hypothetical protein (202) ;mRNA; f:377663-378268
MVETEADCSVPASAPPGAVPPSRPLLARVSSSYAWGSERSLVVVCADGSVRRLVAQSPEDLEAVSAARTAPASSWWPRVSAVCPALADRCVHWGVVSQLAAAVDEVTSRPVVLGDRVDDGEDDEQTVYIAFKAGDAGGVPVVLCERGDVEVDPVEIDAQGRKLAGTAVTLFDQIDASLRTNATQSPGECDVGEFSKGCVLC